MNKNDCLPPKADKVQHHNCKQLMKRLIFLLIILSTTVFADELTLTKEDYTKLVVSNYVQGFNEFDTSVTTVEGGVSVGIYYDYDTQDKGRAESLANRFRYQIPELLKTYEWAGDIKVVVNVFGEDRTNRGYGDY